MYNWYGCIRIFYIGGLTVKRTKAPSNQLSTLSSIMTSRGLLGQMLGKSFGTDRDVYAALGYPKTITYNQYNNKYTRQDIARRIINAFPDATWRGKPEIFETEDAKTTTSFEKSIDDIFKDNSFYQYFLRADKLTGIGRYSILFLGFDDGAELDQEVVNAKQLMYVQPYSEDNAKVNQIENDPKEARFGLPKSYKLSIGVTEESSTTIVESSQEKIVHWSRVLHIAEGLTESNIYGSPRLECIYNRLENLELILGADAEAWWRNAYPGMALEQEAGTTLEDSGDLEDEIDEYIHNFRRVIRLKGMEAKVLAPAIADPEKHVTVQLQMISGATKIPMRILTGSERGELASSQDKENFENAVAERRADFAEPMILRAFIDRLIVAGVIAEPGVDGYSVVWPDIDSMSDKDQAEIGKTRAETIKFYLEAGGEMIIPLMKFLTDIMGYDEDEAEQMISDRDKAMKNETTSVIDGEVDPDEEPMDEEETDDNA